MPQNEATYIHRVGRTARAGHAGRAVTFVEEDRRLLMKEFVRRAVAAKQQIKTRVINKSVIREIFEILISSQLKNSRRRLRGSSQ